MERRFLIVLAGALALLVCQPAFADKNDGDAIVGIRGPKLVLYSDSALKQAHTIKNKAEASKLLQGQTATPVANNAGAWAITLDTGNFFVKKSQVRTERKTGFRVSCDQRVSGSSVGASRGIGESCKP